MTFAQYMSCNYQQSIYEEFISLQKGLLCLYVNQSSFPAPTPGNHNLISNPIGKFTYSSSSYKGSHTVCTFVLCSPSSIQHNDERVLPGLEKCRGICDSNTKAMLQTSRNYPHNKIPVPEIQDGGQQMAVRKRV